MNAICCAAWLVVLSSCIEWFDMDLPWGKRDAMEISVFRRPK